MGRMVYVLLWVMQDFYHQPYEALGAYGRAYPVITVIPEDRNQQGQEDFFFGTATADDLNPALPIIMSVPYFP